MILLSIVISFFIAIVIYEFTDIDKSINAFFILIIGLPLLLAFINKTTSQTIIVGHKDIKIYSSIGSREKIEGSFVLGTGIIQSKEVYLANQEIKPGVFKRIYIPVAKVLRVVEDNLSNYAIYRKYYCVKKSLFGIYDNDHCYMINGKKDKLFIPKNSITKTLNFN